MEGVKSSNAGDDTKKKSHAGIPEAAFVVSKINKRIICRIQNMSIIGCFTFH